jgi:hypothetical protein
LEMRGRRALGVVRRLWVVVDLVQGLAVGAPAALERAGLRIEHDHAPVQIAVRDVELVRILVERRGGDAAQQQISLLVVLLLAGTLAGGAAMPEVGDELAVGGELHEAVAGLRAADIDAAGAVGEDRMLGLGPARNRVRHPPGMQEVAGRVERHHGRRRHATFARRRHDRGGVLLLVEIARPVEHPDHVVLVDEHSGDALEGPFVGQLLGPRRIVFVFGRPTGRRRLAGRHHGDAAQPQDRCKERRACQGQESSIRLHSFLLVQFSIFLSSSQSVPDCSEWWKQCSRPCHVSERIGACWRAAPTMTLSPDVRGRSHEAGPRSTRPTTSADHLAATFQEKASSSVLANPCCLPGRQVGATAPSQCTQV